MVGSRSNRRGVLSALPRTHAFADPPSSPLPQPLPRLSADGTGPACVPETRDWAATAAAIDKLNRSNPRLSIETAAAWLAEERAVGCDEGIARAMRSHAHALRFLGQYDDAIQQYDEAEARFDALNLPAETARTQVGHVTALRYKGRYDEAVELALQSRDFFVAHGDDLSAAKQSTAS